MISCRTIRVAAVFWMLVPGAVGAEVGSLEQPVRVGDIEMEYLYVRKLRARDGSALTFKRTGSVSGKAKDQILDLFRLESANGKTWDLYIDPHHPEIQALPREAPPGLITAMEQQQEAIAGAGEVSYINLTQPSGSAFLPEVVIYSGKLVVARIVGVEGGRDIQVLTKTADETDWKPLGKRGEALTGMAAEQPFLGNLIAEPDGALWLNADFNFPQRNFVFRFDGEKWEDLGPKDGERRVVVSGMDGGLHFFKNDPRLCRAMQRTSREGASIAVFNSEKSWSIAAVSEALLEHTADRWSLKFANGESDLWILWTRKSENGGEVMAIQVTGLGAQDFRGPFTLLKLPEKLYVNPVAVSGTGVIAANILGAESRVRQFYRFTPGDGDSGFSASKPIAVPKATFPDLGWSPGGELFYVRELKPNGVELSRLREDTWSEIARRKPDFEVPVMFKPTLKFGIDGEPIVVWADFYR